VAAGGDPMALEEIAANLAAPFFTPYFGRKSCPLILPLSPRLHSAADPVAALSERAETGPEPERQALWQARGRPVVTMTASDARGFDLAFDRVEIRRDAIASRPRWQFSLRADAVNRAGSRVYAIRGVFPAGAGMKNITGAAPSPCSIARPQRSRFLTTPSRRPKRSGHGSRCGLSRGSRRMRSGFLSARSASFVGRETPSGAPASTRSNSATGRSHSDQAVARHDAFGQRVGEIPSSGGHGV
jgi:CRISPR-associated protein (Cas_Cas5)